ncbi:hypothetical protein BDN67DRAFT_597150 [Paxillus ammoniavirescens]|nr:hypothetical protein BDN67DRAFT_597150 [Paxillus ammoniavirescens]
MLSKATGERVASPFLTFSRHLASFQHLSNFCTHWFGLRHSVRSQFPFFVWGVILFFRFRLSFSHLYLSYRESSQGRSVRATAFGWLLLSLFLRESCAKLISRHIQVPKGTNTVV